MQKGSAGYEALAATSPAGLSRRQLRGFLYSFHGDTGGVFWPLYVGRNTLGRSGSGESLEIEIADPTTSSRHAVILCEANSVVLEDEGSTNGSFVNDQPVGYRGKIEVQDGDRIRFGAYNAAIRLVTR
jgi:pSer/pThr/pTyr-binding forkhead associated (FHA) protein